MQSTKAKDTLVKKKIDRVFYNNGLMNNDSHNQIRIVEMVILK